MAREPKTITLTWRDENYGSIHGAVAFRPQIEPYPSETAHSKIARIYRKHGFVVNHSRASWIASHKPEDTPVKLEEALREAGYDVVHEGCVPSVLEADAPRM